VSESAIDTRGFRRYLTRDKTVVAAVWVVVAVVGFTIYWNLRKQPLFYDAGVYVQEAKGIAAHGLLSKWVYSDERTYGYPLFLRLPVALAGWLQLRPTTGVFLVQWPLFAGSAWLAAKNLFTSRRTRLLAFVAIAANPLLVVYAPQALTESLTLTCVLFVTASLGAAARARTRRSTAAWLVAGAAVSSFSMVVRPGSVLIPVCYAAAAAGILLWPGAPRRWPPIAAISALLVVAFVTPLVPQILINHRHYHSVSPLPVFDLAGLQAKYGLLLARYSTNVSTCGIPQLEFPNPHPPTLTAARVSTLDAVRYYTTTWPNGPEMLTLHVFTGLDPRPFLTYQRDFGKAYERLFQALTLALLFLAGGGIARLVRRLRDPSRRIRIDAVFLGAVSVIFVGSLAISSAEYRFGSVPLITISLLAAAGLSQRWHWRPSRQTAALLVGSYLGALLLWITFSDLLLSTSPIWQKCS
jgi:fumarate reductase subunit C